MSTFRYRAEAEFFFEVQEDTREKADAEAKSIVRGLKCAEPGNGFFTMGSDPVIVTQFDRIIMELDRIAAFSQHDKEMTPQITAGMYWAARHFLGRLLGVDIMMPTGVYAEGGIVTFQWRSNKEQLNLAFSTPDAMSCSYLKKWCGGVITGKFPASNTERAVDMIRWLVEASK